MTTITGKLQLKPEGRRVLACFRDCWVVVTNYLYEIAPKRYIRDIYPPFGDVPALNPFGMVKKPSPVPITAEVLAGVWNLAGDSGVLMSDVGEIIALAREDYVLKEDIIPLIEQVNHTYPETRGLLRVYIEIKEFLTYEHMYRVSGLYGTPYSLDGIDIEGIGAKANAYLLHQEQVSMSIDDVLPSVTDYGTAQELERTKSELIACRAENQALKSELERFKQAPAEAPKREELESNKKELSKANERIAELEQELAGLQSEDSDIEQEPTRNTPYTYIARQTKDRNRRMGMLVAIIESAESAGLIEKQINSSRLRWSEDYSNGQIAYFVAQANIKLGIKSKHRAINWGVWSNLVDGLSATQLRDAKAGYTRNDGDGTPTGYERIDEILDISLP